MSLESIIDIVGGIPFLICTLSLDNDHFANFFCRMLDLIRILSLFRLVNYIENDINRELSIICVEGIVY